MLKPVVALVLATLAAGLLVGCAASGSGSVYSSRQTRSEQSVRLGVVESVRRVIIEGSRSGVGAVAGGATGGVAGSNVGGGKGTTIGSILGAVAGGVAGNVLEERVTRKDGLEITVRLDSGDLRAITQEADEAFKPGERVRLLSGGGTTRVTH